MSINRKDLFPNNHIQGKYKSYHFLSTYYMPGKWKALFICYLVYSSQHFKVNIVALILQGRKLKLTEV